MDLNKFILNTDQYNNLIARSSEYFPELVEKYKDIFDDEQNTPEIIDKILIEWEQEVDERKHKEALQKCNNINAKIKYAYSQGYITTPTIANFLISQGYDISKRTIINNLYQIKVQTKPIDNNLRSEQHIEQLKKCKNTPTRIEYACQQGYISGSVIYNFLKANDVVVNFGSIKDMLSKMSLHKRPINNNLKHEQHIEYLNKCKGSDAQIEYAYQNGYRTSIDIFDFLRANKCNSNIGTIRYIVTNTLKYRQTSNNELENEKHIDFLKKCKTQTTRVQYAYDQGYTKVFEIYNFLKANRYPVSSSAINRIICKNNKIQGERKSNNQAQSNAMNNEIITDVSRSNLLTNSSIEHVDKTNNFNPSVSIETSNTIKNFTTNYSFFTENNTHDGNRNIQITSQQKNQAKQRKI